MKETHHHVLQFVYGTRNLWRQGQCLIQGGVGDQEHLKKTSTFQRYPMKSICTAARQLELPCSTVHRALPYLLL